MKIEHENKKINIHSDQSYDQISSYSLNTRCNAYQTDEPETIKWLNSFVENSVFYDIGSNVGGYSFIAHMANENIKIYSFEPSFMNFYTQIKTCKENNISNIFPMNVAINDNNKFNYFKYCTLGNGGDGSFSDDLKDKMSNSKFSNPFTSKNCSTLEVGILGISLDSLVYDFDLAIPNYLKIDVDGNELLVLKGAKKLLNESKVKEIFIEIDDDIYHNNEVEAFIEKYSFTIVKNINVGTRKKPIRMVLFKR